MAGSDGKERVVFHLDSVDDRPVILLKGSERTRVHLGFFQNDAPGPRDNDWGIAVYHPHKSDHRMAALGVQRDWMDDKLKGFVFARDESGQGWSEPKR